jgi:hypothetical protein
MVYSMLQTHESLMTEIDTTSSVFCIDFRNIGFVIVLTMETIVSPTGRQLLEPDFAFQFLYLTLSEIAPLAGLDPL